MRILITGGAGFFGQHMARRLIDRGDTVCIFGRDEVKQAKMRSAFQDHENLRWFVGDIRDKSRLNRAVQGCQVVIHAAALKRIEVGAYCPDEMAKTNVLGSMNVIEACQSAGVEVAVALSSDKAYQPISPYGQTKALMESLFLSANNMYGLEGPKYVVTRYGNVFGSTGSVIPIWREQLNRGDTVTVTDPECTRFFMTINQAVDLVLDALMKTPSRVLIPSLPACRLGDVATAMGAKMKITGLPDWEKKHESMGENNSSDTATRMTVDELRKALKYV